jgi:multidrug efflux pump
MKRFIEAVVHNSRTTLSLLAIVVVLGTVSRMAITVESDTDISVPMVMVTILHPGISPEDGDRLIVRPMESELRSLEGIDEVTSYARESLVSLMLEFDIDFDPDVAVAEVRAAVDRAQAEIPSTTEEPVVEAVSMTDFPVIVISLTSDLVPERVLYQLAVDLKYDLEAMPEVQEARLSGHREELLEAVINPRQLEHYAISQQELLAAVRNNNNLIAAGAMDTGQGRFSVKVPGLIETRDDVFDLPIRSSGDTVVTLDKVADVRRTFMDRETHTRVNGKPALSVEVVRRPDTNVIDMSEAIRALVAEQTAGYPDEIEVIFSQDSAPFAKQQVSELQGNIVTAMALVMILVVAALGIRSGLLVGAAIPVSFLFALMLLYAAGYSFNFMVMFGMLLGLGMLIDGAIVVTETADRRMAEGMPRREAYIAAAQRMFWPVVASTATTLAAFLPLFFWPGMSGEFMIYLPITVFAVLAGSLLYALCFGPALGALFGKVGSVDAASIRQLKTLEHGDARELRGFTGAYARFLERVLRYPLSILAVVLVILLTIFDLYGRFAPGVIYFTDTDPSYGRVNISARGNFAKEEIHRLLLEAEDAVMPLAGVDSYYTSSSSGNPGFSMFGGSSQPADQIGSIYLDMENVRQEGTSGREVLELARQRLASLAGIDAEIAPQEYGPPTGKDIQIQVSSKVRSDLAPTIARLREQMEQMGGLRDIEDTRTLPGIEWEIVVDRAKAALFNVNVNEVGAAVQLVTNGIYLGEYRPDDAEEEVEIRLRYPRSERNIDMLDKLRVMTASGPVPVSNFVKREARNRLDSIQRVDGEYIMNIRANVNPGLIADNKIQEIQAWIDEQDFDRRVTVRFRGAAEEQGESMEFVGLAFMAALMLMFVLLVTQFNSFFQAGIIVSAVVMSTAGVLLGLLVFNQTFSSIFTGIGIVALAGIVVNNNIVLIDTFNHIRRHHPTLSTTDAVIKTGAQRLRPVFLTTVTTILGLLPLASNFSVDLISREVVYGSQVSAYWVKLASSIVYGLTFASVLTLVVTPLMLVLPERFSRLRDSLRLRLVKPQAGS